MNQTKRKRTERSLFLVRPSTEHCPLFTRYSHATIFPNMENHFLKRSLIAFATILSFGIATHTRAAVTVQPDSLIKASGPAVYWFSRDGKRYTFPNTLTYYSWFTDYDFRSVKLLSDIEMRSIPIGGNVVYRPGFKMVKIDQSNDRVYAVSRFGILRWITSEEIAVKLYGPTWNKRVDDVTDAFYNDYTIGGDITNADQFKVGEEYAAVKNPSDNIPAIYALRSGTTSSSTQKFVAHVGDTVNVTANLQTDQPFKGTIKMYNAKNNSLVKTCTDVTLCTLSYTVTSRPTDGKLSTYSIISGSTNNQTLGSMPRIAFTEATVDATKRTNGPGTVGQICYWVKKDTSWITQCELPFDSSYGKTVTGGTTPSQESGTVDTSGSFTSSTSISLTASGRFLTYNGITVTFTSKVNNPGTDRRNVTIKLYDGDTNQVLNTCSFSTFCVTNLASDVKQVRSVYAKAFDHKGNSVSSAKVQGTIGF